MVHHLLSSFYPHLPIYHLLSLSILINHQPLCLRPRHTVPLTCCLATSLSLSLFLFEWIERWKQRSLQWFTQQAGPHYHMTLLRVVLKCLLLVDPDCIRLDFDAIFVDVIWFVWINFIYFFILINFKYFKILIQIIHKN